MLCSVESGKSSGSTANWLDRLRSNKGFPAADNHLDLDHFLLHNDDTTRTSALSPPIAINASNSVVVSNSNSNSISTESTHSNNRPTAAAAAATPTAAAEVSSDEKDNGAHPHQHQQQHQQEQQQWLNAMSNVLSDLFNVGAQSSSPSLSRKVKAARKQKNPRFCCGISRPSATNAADEQDTLFVRKDENAAARSLNSQNINNNNNIIIINSTGKNFVDEEDVVQEEEQEEEEEEDEEEEEEDEEEEGYNGGGGDKELMKGYSRSEVTVIDTSCEVWKFDKLVFRRKNVWKVRDKKGKSWILGNKKKRKPNSSEFANSNNNGDDDDDDDVAISGAKKKSKVSNIGMDCSLSLASSDAGQKSINRREEVCKETPDDLSQVPRKRFQLPRSPTKSSKSSSSVVLIKAIPTSKKPGRTLLKNRTRDT